MDSEKKEFTREGMQDRRDTVQDKEGCRKGGMQDSSDSGQVGCS